MSDEHVTCGYLPCRENAGLVQILVTFQVSARVSVNGAQSRVHKRLSRRDVHMCYFTTAHLKMVLIWPTSFVISCRHAHHNSACLTAWSTNHSASTPALSTGSLYTIVQSWHYSLLHNRQQTRQSVTNYFFFLVILSLTCARLFNSCIREQ